MRIIGVELSWVYRNDKISPAATATFVVLLQLEVAPTVVALKLQVMPVAAPLRMSVTVMLFVPLPLIY